MLSDTHPVATQGPVWYVGGRTAVTGEPVSWIVIEPGWKVVGRDGEELGRVDEVIGDSNADIFNGLAVSPECCGVALRAGGARRRDRRGTGGARLRRRQFKDLDEQPATPASAEIRADTTDLQ